MDTVGVKFLQLAGTVAPMALGAIGSSIGCGVAGNSLHGAMKLVDEGHGKLIGMSAAPSSQTIYGIVLMFILKGKITNPETAAGLFGIGVLCGLAIMTSAIYQGIACATGIKESAIKSEIYGKSWVPIAMVEGFAVFTMVFGIIAAGML
ncbi:MAG: ATP synthase subunit C [Candidatus Coatesbacteria bacterium]|nr:ATP synthase subunit C [Candidatus Coatesbacteria bacterium]